MRRLSASVVAAPTAAGGGGCSAVRNGSSSSSAPTTTTIPAAASPLINVILYDDDCLLCLGCTRFLVTFDTECCFKLASAQSKVGMRLLTAYGLIEEGPSSSSPSGGAVSASPSSPSAVAPTPTTCPVDSMVLIENHHDINDAATAVSVSGESRLSAMSGRIGIESTAVCRILQGLYKPLRRCYNYQRARMGARGHAQKASPDVGGGDDTTATMLQSAATFPTSIARHIYCVATALLLYSACALFAAVGWAVMVCVPKGLRDAAYRWVARNRYRILGRRAEGSEPIHQCLLPTAEVKRHFLYE